MPLIESERLTLDNKIVFERVQDYWGKDLNVNKGVHNFDHFKLTYFFDLNVMLQALRAGVFDYRFDQNEKTFATAYDFVGYHKGLFKKETYTMGESYGMHYGVVLNTRRDPFKEIRVREALTLAYNFEWANRVFWHDGMDRNNSYFMRSGLQVKGLPSREELALLEPFRDDIPARVFTHRVPTAGKTIHMAAIVTHCCKPMRCFRKLAGSSRIFSVSTKKPANCSSLNLLFQRPSMNAC